MAEPNIDKMLALTNSKYSLSVVVAKRALQLKAGKKDALVIKCVGGRVDGAAKIVAGIGAQVYIGMLCRPGQAQLQVGDTCLHIGLLDGNIVGNGIVNAALQVPFFLGHPTNAATQ